jgi:hypothetical protein
MHRDKRGVHLLGTAMKFLGKLLSEREQELSILAAHGTRARRARRQARAAGPHRQRPGLRALLR